MRPRGRSGLSTGSGAGPVHHFRLLAAVPCQEAGVGGGVGSEGISGVTQTNVDSICSYDKASKPSGKVTLSSRSFIHSKVIS